jgi:hypothetical protein
VGEDSVGRQSGQRVTVDEAARHYGLTVDAIRKRVQRKKIPHEKDSAGRVRIILDEPETLQDESPDRTGQRAAQVVRGELIEELRDRVRYLEKALDEEREARTEERRRHDTVLAQLSAANAEQARTIRELEAPREATETVEDVPEGAEPRVAAEEQQGRGQPQSAAGGAREGARPRSWWRRMLGR